MPLQKTLDSNFTSKWPPSDKSQQTSQLLFSRTSNNRQSRSEQLCKLTRRARSLAMTQTGNSSNLQPKGLLHLVAYLLEVDLRLVVHVPVCLRVYHQELVEGQLWLLVQQHSQLQHPKISLRHSPNKSSCQKSSRKKYNQTSQRHHLSKISLPGFEASLLALQPTLLTYQLMLMMILICHPMHPLTGLMTILISIHPLTPQEARCLQLISLQRS